MPSMMLIERREKGQNFFYNKSLARGSCFGNFRLYLGIAFHNPIFALIIFHYSEAAILLETIFARPFTITY